MLQAGQTGEAAAAGQVDPQQLALVSEDSL